MIAWHPEGRELRVAYVGDVRLLVFRMKPDGLWLLTIRGADVGIVGLGLAFDEESAKRGALAAFAEAARQRSSTLLALAELAQLELAALSQDGK